MRKVLKILTGQKLENVLDRADLRSTFVGGILIRIQECPSDKTDLWHKIAQTLEGMEAAAQKAENNAGTGRLMYYQGRRLT